MANYRKLVAALVSIGVLGLHTIYGWNYGPVSADIVTTVLIATNPVVVWLLPNTKPAD